MKSRIILLLLICCPLYFYGWGAEGHKIVAEIAQKKINKKVKKKVQKYLGATSFQDAAVWMDVMRSDHSYDYMKPWHYLNIEKGDSYSKASTGDILSELDLVIAELKNYKTMKTEDVNKDLKILFHLCGDYTMPLHVGYGSDKGGNDVKIAYKNKTTNLHHVWDSDIIDSAKITTTICLMEIKNLTPAQIKSTKTIDLMQWMNDSRVLLDKVYSINDKTLTQEYINQNKEIVEQQLAIGGLRLATILNEIFGAKK